MAQTILSLYDVSAKLGVSPSAIKKRVASLNLPVERGARGKLLFNEEAYATLCRADELLKAGNGFEACRRELGLEGAPVTDLALGLDDEAVETPVAEVGMPAEAAAVAEAVTAPEPATEAEAVVAAAPVAAPTAPDAGAFHESVVPAIETAAPVSVGNHGGALPAPVFIQLGRRKPSDSVRMRMVEHQPTSTPMPGALPASEPVAAPQQPPRAEAPAPAVTPREAITAAIDPDLLARLDAALKLIEDKDKHNHMLQSKLLVAYDEMTKLSATAAAFQERSMNLQHEVQKLQGEIRLLTAPPETKPWWKFWG